MSRPASSAQSIRSPMIRYILQRLLLSIFTLGVISLIAFGISKMAAGDPVLISLSRGESLEMTQDRYYLSSYKSTAKKFGLDKPVFYFSIAPQSYPDTLYRLYPQSHRQNVRRMIGQYGNWPEISRYWQECRNFEQRLFSYRTSTDSLIRLQNTYKQLTYRYKKADTDELVEKIRLSVRRDSMLRTDLEEHFTRLASAYAAMIDHATPQKNYIPSFTWYGPDNQYHNWLKSMLSGEMGKSYIEQRAVSKKLNEAIWITVQMNLMAIVLAFLLAIPIGVYAARRRGKAFDQLSTLFLFFLYSIPTFWIATLAVIFLTTNEYGMDLFPSMGLGNLPKDASLWKQFSTRMQHLILPVLCIAVGGIAFIVRQVRGSMQEVLEQDYIRTARAKGLPEAKVIWRHAFKNAIFPLITLIANIIPALITGSIVIERIFNIPGMGFVTIEAIFQRDWPVVFAVLMIGAVLTVLAILITDILYVIFDPRIKFKGLNK